jgi:hypothetical protein
MMPSSLFMEMIIMQQSHCTFIIHIDMYLVKKTIMCVIFSKILIKYLFVSKLAKNKVRKFLLPVTYTLYITCHWCTIFLIDEWHTHPSQAPLPQPHNPA